MIRSLRLTKMAESISQEQYLEMIVKERTNDLRWTKTIYFKMSNWMAYSSKGFNFLLLLTTGTLAAVLSQGWLTSQMQLLIASIATTLSLVDILFSPDRLSFKYEKNGEMCNSLLKEFEEYYYLVLKDEGVPITEKKSKLEELTVRHRKLNETTPSTWDFIASRTTQSDLGGEIDFEES